MSKEYYRQCSLRLDLEGGGYLADVVWIPEIVRGQPVRVGRQLKIKIDEEWVDGWVVTDLGSTRREIAEVQQRSRDHLRQRKFSDV